MLKIIKYVLKNNPNVKIIIENNASMAHKWRDIITLELVKIFKKPVYCNYIDSSKFVMQRRRRYYWTLKEIPEYSGKRLQTMESVLIPIEETEDMILSDKAINYLNSTPSYMNKQRNGFIIQKHRNYHRLIESQYKTRLYNRGSSSLNNYIKCIDTNKQNAFILDYRIGIRELFVPRYLSKAEINKIFNFPPNYVATNKSSIYHKLYGMSVVPPVISYILSKY
jgi:hypothetical protein